MTSFRLMFLMIVLSAVAASSSAQSLGPGIDCGCSATGAYVDLESGVLPEVMSDSTSPGGTYKIFPSGSGPYTFVIRRTSDGAIVYNNTIQNGFWGFSPDDDRFVFHYLSAGQIIVTLVDLTSPSSNKVIWQTSLSGTDRYLGFSLNGNYLLLSALHSATSASLQVINAHTGAPAYNSNPFTFSPAGDTTDAFGVAGWGFSPDLSDRTLFYAYVTGGGVLQWRMVNLESGQVANPAPVTHVSGFWQFSPCGDMLGLVIQPNPTSMRITLHPTGNPQSTPLAAMDVTNQVSYVAFSSTAVSHIAAINGVEYALAPNLAADVCFIVPDSLILTPDTVLGGNPVSARVTLSSPAKAGGATVALSSNNGAATVPATVLVPSGQREKTFTIQTSLVGTTTRPVISASADGVTIRDTLTLLPLGLNGMSGDRTSIIGGDTVFSTISLSGPSPSPGTSVILVSSAPSVVSVSSPLIIPTNQTSATSALITTPVARLDSVKIYAIALGDTLSITIFVNPFVTLSFDPDTIVGGNSVAYIVSRAIPAPAGGLTFQATSSDSSVVILPQLTIPEGWTTIWVNPLTTHGVSQPTSVTAITRAQGRDISATLTVLPAKLSGLQALPDSGCVVGGPGALRNTFIAGATILFEALLDGESPPTDEQLSLTSSDPGLVVIPISVLVPARQRKVTFLVQTSSQVQTTQEVIITAEYRGMSQQDTLRLLSPPIRYTFTDITPPGGAYVQDMEINNANQILLAGTGETGDTGFLWREGVFERLDSLAGLVVWNAALNDSGWVGGADSLLRPAIWKGSSVELLPSLDSLLTNGHVIALNNHGEAIGVFGNRINQSYHVLWRDATVQQFGPYPPFGLYAIDINDSGIIVLNGYYYNSITDQAQAAFLWEDGTFTRLYHPYGSAYYWYMYGRAINDIGTVVLSFNAYYNYGDSQFYIWSNGVTTILNSVDPFNRINPMDVNNEGSVVGGLRRKIEDMPELSSAFVLADGKMYDLHCLASFPPGWELQEALSINDAGAIVGRALFNGSDRAFLLTPGGTLTTTERNEDEAIPTVCNLEQNYPNPFNPSTQIRYSLPTSSKVRLTVHDLLGREVAVLVDEVQSAGHREAVWDASRFASGVYLYRLTTGTFTQTRKMIVLK